MDTIWDAMGPVLAEGRSAAPDSGKANQALPQVVKDGSIPAVHGGGRWRRIDLAQGVFEVFRISIAMQPLSRAPRRMGTRQARAAARSAHRHGARPKWNIEEYLTAARGKYPCSPQHQQYFL